MVPRSPWVRLLADEWHELEHGGAEGQNVSGEFDADVVILTAPSVGSGQTPVFTENTVVAGAQVQVSSQRFFKVRVHIKKARNRALKSIVGTMLEVT